MNATQLLASIALWTASSSVLAASADRLTYEAPPGCPSRPEFLAAVAARGADVGQPRATDHRRLVVSIRRGGAGFEGAFHMSDDRDASDNREVAGSSCGEVADALAMVTAIALDTAPQDGTGATAQPSPGVVAAASEALAAHGATSAAEPPSVRAPKEEGMRGRTRIFPPRSETVQVHAGALTFDLARSVTIYAGVTAGLIPSVVLPRYDASMSVASFITTPDGDHRISGVIFQPRLSFLGRGTYESFDTKTDITGLSFSIDICQSPRRERLMSSNREWPGDSDFERRLLDSARGDVSPVDGRQAWARFAGQFSAALPAARANLGEAGQGGRATAAGHAMTAPGTAWVAVAKWVVLGAIGGSGLTAGLLVDRHRDPVELSAAHRGSSIGTAAVRQDRGEVTTGSSEPAGPPVGPSVGDTVEATRPRRPAKERVRALRHRGDSARGAGPARGDGFAGEDRLAHEDASTLAAEVERIDDARTALSGGDPDRAMRLVEDYHRAFPSGVLAPDADVVALEASAAKDDHVETAQRAARFLTRYPNDPHAAWVRALLDSTHGP